jgi:hypothetical protein
MGRLFSFTENFMRVQILHTQHEVQVLAGSVVEAGGHILVGNWEELEPYLRGATGLENMTGRIEIQDRPNGPSRLLTYHYQFENGLMALYP